MSLSKVNTHYLIEQNDIEFAKTLDIMFGCHIGKGVFADVYTAKFKSNKVVLKATHRSKCSKKTFESEILIAKTLINHSHENVVQFLSVFDNHNKSQSWTIMSWIDGEDMHRIQKRNKAPFAESVAKYYFKQLVAGLQFLHSLGIVHRDIKPHNILIARNKQNIDIIKYIDFGFAKLVTVVDNQAICSSHKGSQVYMAPELMSDDKIPYDAFKSDIYSLAIVLYEMLFNFLPFGNSDLGIDRAERNDLMQKLKENLVIRYPQNSNVSESAKKLFENMICCESEKRYNLQQITESEWFKI